MFNLGEPRVEVLRLKLELDDPCPCGSMKLISVCGCMQQDGRLLPPEAVISTAVKHRYNHPRCFASALGNCSRKLSHEHYISHGIIRQVEKTYRPGEQLIISGFSWQTSNEVQRIAPNSLTSQVLCKWHNNVLSPLDTIGGNFFQAFQQIHYELQHHSTPRRYYLFNGHDIERWMLKTLCGIIASGNANNVSKNTKPPIEYLTCLFQGKKLPFTWGLYLLTYEGKQAASGGIKLEVIADEIVHGLLMEFLAFRFFLAVHIIPEKTGLFAKSFNRPDFLYFQCDKSKREAAILIRWDIERDGGLVNIAANFDS